MLTFVPIFFFYQSDIPGGLPFVQLLPHSQQQLHLSVKMKQNP